MCAAQGWPSSQKPGGSGAQHTDTHACRPACPHAHPLVLATLTSSPAFLTSANVNVHPRVIGLGFSSRGKEILLPKSFESVAMKGLLTRKNKKMSLADGNNFNAKCHLLMIAPLAVAASRKTALSQGPGSDQTVLYFPLPPLSPELCVSPANPGSSQHQPRPPPGEGKGCPLDGPPCALCHSPTFRSLGRDEGLRLHLL